MDTDDDALLGRCPRVRVYVNVIEQEINSLPPHLNSTRPNTENYHNACYGQFQASISDGSLKSQSLIMTYQNTNLRRCKPKKLYL
jgi:hypothetical protein